MTGFLQVSAFPLRIAIAIRVRQLVANRRDHAHPGETMTFAGLV
jgi:hypothetical protein